MYRVVDLRDYVSPPVSNFGDANVYRRAVRTFYQMISFGKAYIVNLRPIDLREVKI